MEGSKGKPVSKKADELVRALILEADDDVIRAVQNEIRLYNIYKNHSAATRLIKAIKKRQGLKDLLKNKREKMLREAEAHKAENGYTSEKTIAYIKNTYWKILKPYERVWKVNVLYECYMLYPSYYNAKKFIDYINKYFKEKERGKESESVRRKRERIQRQNFSRCKPTSKRV